MSDAKIIVKQSGWQGYYGVYLSVGNRLAYLPDSQGWEGATPRSHAIRRGRWWSERTGIPFEESTDD